MIPANSESDALAVNQAWHAKRHHPACVAAMVLLMCLLLALTALRTYRNCSTPSTTFDWENRGLSDFNNGAYLPARAFLNGRSPYCAEVAEEYKMSRETPPYSPVVFILHVPFAWLPLNLSQVAFFVFNFGLLATISACSIKMSQQPFRWFDFLALTNLLLISRPGHITMFTGYFTAEIVIGCMLALHYANSRPA